VKPERPNVVLLTVDSLRADCVEAGLTPSLARFAGEAVVFASAFFKFTWALRLSYYKGVLISGAPTKEAEAAEKDAFLTRAEALTALIAKHFLREI